VAADVGRAARHHALEQRDDTVHAGDAELAAAAAIVRDPVRERVARRVRHPRPAVERLVEVGVGVDEAGQHEPAADVDDLGGLELGPDRRDDAVAHEDVGGAVVAPGAAAA
jgi:hypothetical protein